MLAEEFNAETMLSIANGKCIEIELGEILNRIKEVAKLHECDVSITLKGKECGMIMYPPFLAVNREGTASVMQKFQPVYYAKFINTLAYLRKLGFIVLVTGYTTDNLFEINKIQPTSIGLHIYWGSDALNFKNKQVTKFETNLIWNLEKQWEENFINPTIRDLY